MKVSFTQKIVWGKTLFYPNNDAAISICLIAEQKTLTLDDLNKLQKGGFNLEVVADTLPVFKTEVKTKEL